MNDAQTEDDQHKYASSQEGDAVRKKYLCKILFHHCHPGLLDT